MPDPALLAVLTDALTRDPDNAAVRLHLASLLLEGGDAPAALDHLTTILAKQPSRREALLLASKAAEATGDKLRAHGYKQLYDALSWNQARNLIGGDAELTTSADEPPKGFDDRAPALTTRGDRPGQPPTSRPEDRLGNRQGNGDDEPSDMDHLVETSDTTLADVAGLEDVKRRLNLAFLAPMKNPEMMKLYGRSLRGGLLLYGPPGCGKTYIARAVAGELGARFVSIGLSDVLDMWIGNSERNLHEIFETARRNRPSVLFFDEIDALGRKRSLQRHNGGHVVNQLLAEMDSLNGNNEGVFILAATNHPWDVDSALRRPGRLDRTLLVSPPDVPAREAILRNNLRERPMEGIDYAYLSRETDNFSGADISHLVESAAELAMEDSIKTGNVRPINMTDFKRALREVKPSTRPWFDTARNFALFSNDGGAYDDLAAYLRAKKMM